MRPTVRAGVWSAWLAVLLVVVILASATVGPVRIEYAVVAKALLNAVPAVSIGGFSPYSLGVPILGAVAIPVPNVVSSPLFSFSVSNTESIIVTKIRMPRIVVGAIVGFALASAGTVMQGFFRNPMADPSIIGVSSGAAVGAVATIVLPTLVPFGLAGTAFAGALLTAFGVYQLASEGGQTPVATLLLAGVAVQTFLGAVISFLLLNSGESLSRVVYWLMGHLHNANWHDAAISLPVVTLGFAVLLVYAQDLNVLLLGEEDAHNLGIEVERTKRVLLAVSSIITAIAVAVSGVIGFVGLVVPHVMRLLVGPDHRVLLPTSAIAGAVFLVATDTVARSGPAEIPVGIVTAFLGAPFFLYLLRNREVHSL